MEKNKTNTGIEVASNSNYGKTEETDDITIKYKFSNSKHGNFLMNAKQNKRNEWQCTY